MTRFVTPQMTQNDSHFEVFSFEMTQNDSFPGQNVPQNTPSPWLTSRQRPRLPRKMTHLPTLVRRQCRTRRHPPQRSWSRTAALWAHYLSPRPAFQGLSFRAERRISPTPARPFVALRMTTKRAWQGSKPHFTSLAHGLIIGQAFVLTLPLSFPERKSREEIFRCAQEAITHAQGI